MLQDLIEKLDMEQLLTRAVGYLPDVIASMILIAIFWFVLLVVRKALKATLDRAGSPEGVQQIFQRFAKYAIVILALLTIANQLGINITSLIAGIGVAGLALSLAAQDTVANIIAGITLLTDKPFKVGDWIRIDDLNAQVADIRLRVTELRSFENETVVMPNRQITSERIINYTLHPRIRVRVPLGIAYKEDTQTAREVMLGTLQGDQDVLDTPEPAVVVMELGASSVDMEMRFWIDDPMQMYAKRSEYIEKCKWALDAAGIEIPFPHMQLFLERSEGLSELVGARK